MVFLRGANQHDSWLRFCEKHRAILTQTGLPPSIIHAEHRFRDLLREGMARTDKEEASLSRLEPVQWSALEQFASIFFNEFESYAPLDLFPAFRREAARRTETRS